MLVVRFAFGPIEPVLFVNDITTMRGSACFESTSHDLLKTPIIGAAKDIVKTLEEQSQGLSLLLASTSDGNI
jgi:hypothetical protein